MPSKPDRSGPPAGYVPRITDAATLEAALDRLPEQPGVYVMRDRAGEVVYVGKANRLRVRVRQYFNGHDPRAFVPLLEHVVGDIETIVTRNDKEALLLENNLVKQHQPRYNVKLRDDKNYLVLRLDPKASWPRLELVRRIRQDGAQYFGPYHSAVAARASLRVVNRHFKLRTCTDWVLQHRTRPCLQYQIGRCPAPCVHEVEPTIYADQVRDVGVFLSGRVRELLSSTRERMENAAAALDFESAARLRDQVHALESVLTAQHVVGTDAVDQDVIGMYREGGQIELAVLQIRDGRMLGSQTFSERGMELPDAEVLAGFLDGYYEGVPAIPDEILLPGPLAPDDAEPLLQWLNERKGRKVELLEPRRGNRRRLVELAIRNATSNFVTRRNRREDTERALLRLQERLGLSRPPHVIECFDVSHIQGSDTVASMVVFVDGVAERSRYRSFKVKRAAEAPANDDFASMYEILSRRLHRALEGDESWALPDLLVIDGGKGQLGRAVAALQDLGIPIGAEGVDVVALAKERRGTRRGREALLELQAEGATSDPARPGAAWEDRVVARDQDPDAYEVVPERVFVVGAKEALALRAGSSERHLMERIRDEAHRFAITHHRKRRSRRAIESRLDDIPGIGPELKRALVRHFGSISAIRGAELDALRAVRGVGARLAQRIHEALRTDAG